MRLVYCPHCRHVSMKSRLERDRCENCSREARVVRVPFPWQYFAGLGIVIAGAFFIVLPQVAGEFPWGSLVATLPLRLVWLVVFVGVGFYFSSWGLRRMKESALERGAALYPEAEA